MADTPKVRHRPLIPFDYGTLREDAATLYVNNRVFQGWKQISISKSMLSMAGSFSITITDVWKPNERFQIKSGDRIHCHIGKEAIFEGFVDVFNISITAGSRNITVNGRDRTADLIDSSITTAADFNKVGLQAIAESICKPFGIKVLNTFGHDLGEVFEKFSIKQGETAFQAINRAAKSRQIILLTSTHGNLLFDKRGKRRAPNELVEGVNIEISGANFDNSQRFSEYIVKGQQPGLLGDPKDASQSKGTAQDSAITRHRPKIIMSDQSADGTSAQKRAEFELSYQTAKSFTCSGTVTNWRRDDGSVWKPNELVFLSAPSLGIRKEQLLISDVKYKSTESGRSCEIKMIRKDAFEFEKEKKPEGDILSTIGY